jgi:hypothetical protein
MTSEQKVKQVYPQAHCRNVGRFAVPCFEIQAYGEVGHCIGLSGHRASWAWADAWRNIQRNTTERIRK